MDDQLELIFSVVILGLLYCSQRLAPVIFNHQLKLFVQPIQMPEMIQAPLFSLPHQ